jgi:protein SCO1/2/putative membrane protein
MRRLLVVGLVVAFAALWTLSFAPSVHAQTSVADEPIGEVSDFTLIERSGREVSKSELDGKVWVACFVFTRCGSACPQVTETMHRIQERVRAVGYPDVNLVSITVDPEHDTPEVLQAYAAGHDADPTRWLFLTGKQDDVYRLILEGFHISVAQNQGKDRFPGNEVSHSSRLVLVDRQGRIRGLYDGRKEDADSHEPIDDVQRLMRDIARVRGGYYQVDQVAQPPTNAVLNAASAALLLAGFLFIRGKRVGPHKVCMLTALAVSAVFLASYLYYHFIIRVGSPTRFSGPAEVRSVYLAILLTHTVLAAVVAPLALFTAYLGLTGRLARHMRIARWTLPIWLYVSITGVVVYWMLYHLYPAA